VKKRNKILLLSFAAFILSYFIFCLVWSSSYDPQTHNCMHMSEELEDTFELLPGIKAEVVFGEGSESHMWIRVYSLNIESKMPLPLPSKAYQDAFPHQEVYADFCEFAHIYLQGQ